MWLLKELGLNQTLNHDKSLLGQT